MRRSVLRMARPTPPKPLAERGRILYAEDIAALYRGRRTRDWILRNFLPESRQKDGKLVFWWECDVTKFFDEMSAA